MAAPERRPLHRHSEARSGSPAAPSASSVQARKALGEERLLVIGLHDLRWTRATLLLADGVPVTVVSERLGPADVAGDGR